LLPAVSRIFACLHKTDRFHSPAQGSLGLLYADSLHDGVNRHKAALLELSPQQTSDELLGSWWGGWDFESSFFDLAVTGFCTDVLRQSSAVCVTVVRTVLAESKTDVFEREINRLFFQTLQNSLQHQKTAHQQRTT
jgi:hypothetical protein